MRFRGGVLRAILRQWRGANGAFCRGIPRFLDWSRVWRGDSAHGGQRRAGWAKKFLKKGRKTEKLGCGSAERWPEGTLYRVRGAILGLEARPLAALLDVHFVQVPQLRVPAMR